MPTQYIDTDALWGGPEPISKYEKATGAGMAELPPSPCERFDCESLAECQNEKMCLAYAAYTKLQDGGTRNTRRNRLAAIVNPANRMNPTHELWALEWVR